MLSINIFPYRSGPREPTGWCVHQRATTSEPHSAEDRAHGVAGSAALRHQPHAASVARLRQQDSPEIPSKILQPAFPVFAILG